jgi:hypothetical protein
MSEFVNRYDVLVVETARVLGFAVEALQKIGIVGVADRHDLDGDHAIEEGVFGTIHDPHSSPTDHIEDIIFADLLGYGCSHVRGVPEGTAETKF